MNMKAILPETLHAKRDNGCKCERCMLGEQAHTQNKQKNRSTLDHKLSLELYVHTKKILPEIYYNLSCPELPTLPILVGDSRFQHEPPTLLLTIRNLPLYWVSPIFTVEASYIKQPEGRSAAEEAGPGSVWHDRDMRMRHAHSQATLLPYDVCLWVWWRYEWETH